MTNECYHPNSGLVNFLDRGKTHEPEKPGTRRNLSGKNFHQKPRPTTDLDVVVRVRARVQLQHFQLVGLLGSEDLLLDRDLGLRPFQKPLAQ